VNSIDRVGRVASLWRYPVKSMMGEELNASEVGAAGLAGDRAYAIIDRETGKVASAKNPKKWPNLFDFRASYTEAPGVGATLPPVRITLPDGSQISSDDPNINTTLSHALGRDVKLEHCGPVARNVPAAPSIEEYWPTLEGLPHQDTVTDEAIPPGTFFDAASVHVLTTATLESLRSHYPKGRFEVRRFRPNVVVTVSQSDASFVEDGWIGSSLALGDSVRLKAESPCPRCVMTTLPQGDLPPDLGILRTAVQHNHAAVGIYTSVEAGGMLRRGDEIAVVSAAMALADSA
jgi:MOSC domain-containing protein